MWTLTIRTTDSSPREFDLKPGVTSLGRDPQAEICLPDSSVSWQHAELRIDGPAGAVAVGDAGTAGGTFVGQQRIQQWQAVGAADVIRIGPYLLTLTERMAEQPAASASEAVLPASEAVPVTHDLLVQAFERYAVLLADADERLNGVTDVDMALSEVVDLTKRLLGADECDVVLAADFPPHAEAGCPTQRAWQTAVDQKAAVIVPRLWPVSAGPCAQAAGQPPEPTTVVYAPMLTAGAVTGLLCASKTDPASRPFDRHDLLLAMALSHRAGLAVQRANLMQLMERRVAARTHELAALYNVALVASDWLDPNAILKEALALTLKAVGEAKGAIFLVEDNGTCLRLVEEQGVAPGLAAELKTLPAGPDRTGWLTDGDQPRISLDLTADTRRFPAELQRFRSYAGAPLHALGRRLGTLCVFDFDDRRFDAETIALLSTIADQIGVAVENARLRKQAEQAAVRRERSRLARELHDSVTQSLYTLGLFAGAGRRLADGGDLAQVQAHLEQIEALTRQALKEMRLLVHQLRLPVLDQEGLLPALRRRLEMVEQRAGVQTDLQVDGLSELPVPVEEGLYWIAVESLNNALKHAQANSVAVHVSVGESTVNLEVADNGLGFDVPAARSAAGMGLANMRERAEGLGGTLDIHSTPGRGTRVCLHVPLSSALAAARAEGGCQCDDVKG